MRVSGFYCNILFYFYYSQCNAHSDVKLAVAIHEQGLDRDVSTRRCAGNVL